MSFEPAKMGGRLLTNKHPTNETGRTLKRGKEKCVAITRAYLEIKIRHIKRLVDPQGPAKHRSTNGQQP